jgi:hypothetical protein
VEDEAGDGVLSLLMWVGIFFFDGSYVNSNGDPGRAQQRFGKRTTGVQKERPGFPGL